MMKKILFSVTILFFLATLTLSGWKVYTLLREYHAGSEAYSSLTSLVTYEEPAALPTEPNGTEPEQGTMPAETEPDWYVDDTAWPLVDFEALRGLNGDTVAWIVIPGTKISYPVVQGQDNAYYLDHLFDGTPHKAGCVFLDAGNASDLSDANSVIYGHHLRDGSMFTKLMGYKKQAFYDEHPMALLITPQRKYQILFFSGYVANTRADAWELTFTEEEFAPWLEELVEKSNFRPQQLPTAEDRVVTLSTCTYEFNNARYVLHGFLRDCGPYGN